MSTLPTEGVYGLTVPPGNMVPAEQTGSSITFRITMAAIDPDAEIDDDVDGLTRPPRATLKLIRVSHISDDSELGSDDSDELKALMGLVEPDEGEDQSAEANGGKRAGPSDPSKVLKARKAKELAEVDKAVDGESSDDGIIIKRGANGSNGKLSSKAKGKAPATNEGDSESDEDEILGVQKFVLCTLDPVQHCQQPLDIVIGNDEQVYFQVSGTHPVYLTGNYIAMEEDRVGDQLAMYGSGAYGYSSDEDEDEMDVDEEADELDDIDDPRVVELSSGDDEVPELSRKSKAKKPNEERAKKPVSSTDKKPVSTNKDQAMLPHLSTKRSATEAEIDPQSEAQSVRRRALATAPSVISQTNLKKMKNNSGEAVQPPADKDELPKGETAKENGSAVKDKTAKDDGAKDKKVQFAKDLETEGGSKAEVKANKSAVVANNKPGKTDDAKTGKSDARTGESDAKSGKSHAKSSKSHAKSGKTDAETGTKNSKVKTIQGVIIDERKIGTGPVAKVRDKVSVRYIGRLQSTGEIFDANKGGPPFRFTLGVGEVVPGWDIGIKGMAAGGERKITIPPELAYRKTAVGKIPPNSTLVFDVKVLSVGH